MEFGACSSVANFHIRYLLGACQVGRNHGVVSALVSSKHLQRILLSWASASGLSHPVVLPQARTCAEIPCGAGHQSQVHFAPHPGRPPPPALAAPSTPGRSAIALGCGWRDQAGLWRNAALPDQGAQGFLFGVLAPQPLGFALEPLRLRRPAATSSARAESCAVRAASRAARNATSSARSLDRDAN